MHTFELQPFLKEELSFSDASWEFDLLGLPFDVTKYPYTVDGAYTNLAYLLSDQCRYAVKIVSIDREGKVSDQHSFSGSLLRQRQDVLAFVDAATAERSENGKAFSAVLSEVLVNALLHRDYESPVDTLVRITPDSVTVVSAGGIASGFDTDDVMNGISVFRNPALAEIFVALGLATGCGVGLAAMKDTYLAAEEKPAFTATEKSVKVTLPRKTGKSTASYVTDEERVIRFAKAHNAVTRQDVEKEFSVSASTASRLLRRMAEEGLLLQIGSARSTKYRLP